MNETETEIGVYGFANGLGYHGDNQTKVKLARRVARAIERGDWDRVVRYAAAYYIGSSIGSRFRQPELKNGWE